MNNTASTLVSINNIIFIIFTRSKVIEELEKTKKYLKLKAKNLRDKLDAVQPEFSDEINQKLSENLEALSVEHDINVKQLQVAQEQLLHLREQRQATQHQLEEERVFLLS